MRGVDNDVVEPRERYEPEKRNGGNKHVRRHLWLFVVAAVGCWVIWGLGEGLFYYWLDTNDPWATLRMIVEKIMTVVPGFTCAWLAVLFVDWVTFGNVIRGILHGNMACSVFASVVFFGTLFLYLRIIL